MAHQYLNHSINASSFWQEGTKPSIVPCHFPENRITGFGGLCKSKLYASAECPGLKVDFYWHFIIKANEKTAEREYRCAWLEV